MEVEDLLLLIRSIRPKLGLVEVSLKGLTIGLVVCSSFC